MRKVRRKKTRSPYKKIKHTTNRGKMMLRKSKERRISFVFINPQIHFLVSRFFGECQLSGVFLYNRKVLQIFYYIKTYCIYKLQKVFINDKMSKKGKRGQSLYTQKEKCMSKVNWTKEQQDAIYENGSNILVAAAAR